MTDDHTQLAAAQQLLDIEAIKQLKARYFRGLDTKQWEAFAEVFTEDAAIDVSDDMGPESGVICGRDTIVRTISEALATAITVHHGHMPEITLDGPDRAHGIWAMNDYVAMAPGQGMRGYGHYEETYRKIDGAWRIATMTLTRLRIDPIE